MEGPPRILQGWSETLGPSLTYLELGVSPTARMRTIEVLIELLALLGRTCDDPY